MQFRMSLNPYQLATKYRRKSVAEEASLFFLWSVWLLAFGSWPVARAACGFALQCARRAAAQRALLLTRDDSVICNFISLLFIYMHRMNVF